ncbi:MAG TPA: three-Cys-motif partner protein TcmP [Rhizomicrobium sp.]|jgi:three-Cys-motif partner protein|nr:three-Cys-motif partner protein TcmP [Rhizomicrobium sp.]
MPQKFGSNHTEDKLDKLEAYLKTFTTALKKQQFRLIYFDAFAGTPERDLGDQAPSLPIGDVERFLSGSTKRALSFGDQFERYIFVESKRSNIRELEALRDRYPAIKDRIDIRHGDANAQIEAFCANWQRNQRAVVFLDPFDNQVAWRTMEALAATGAVDVWYLFPAGLGVHRQISRDGSHEGREETLDRLLGATDWREKFIESVSDTDLFGAATRRTKVATPESVTLYMIDRMKTIFKGGVLDDWLPLGSNGRHSYSLLFACANPDPKAYELAHRLARGVLWSKKSGRS